jgi:hypothetical protein
MKQYKVIFADGRKKEQSIKAKSKKEAIELARQIYKCGFAVI